MTRFSRTWLLGASLIIAFVGLAAWEEQVQLTEAEYLERPREARYAGVLRTAVIELKKRRVQRD